MDFHQFLESNQKNNSNEKESIAMLADVIRKAFKKMTLRTRQEVWDLLTSKKGKKEMERFILNPEQSLGRIRSLPPSSKKNK